MSFEDLFELNIFWVMKLKNFLYKEIVSKQVVTKQEFANKACYFLLKTSEY